MSGPHQHLVLHHRSPLHRLKPEVKVVAVVLFSLGVALTPRTAIAAFALDAVVLVAALAVAGYRLPIVIRRAVVIIPFLVFAALLPFVATGDQTAFGPFSLSTAGLWGAWNTLAKTTLGFGAALVLAGTTSPADLVSGLERLRVPKLLVSIVGFMFRYLDLLLDELSRVRRAMTARGHDPRWLWQAKPLASASGAMFVRSYEQGERVHAAMLARGFTGSLPFASTGPAPAGQWFLALTVGSIPLLAAAIAATQGAL